MRKTNNMGFSNTIWGCRIKYLILYVFKYVNPSIMIAANYSEFRGDLKKFLDLLWGAEFQEYPEVQIVILPLSTV